MHLHHYALIAEQFASQRPVVDVREFGNGNINDTYLITLASGEEKHFVLQRINTQVFKQPGLIMQNMCTFTEHMRNRAHQEGHHWDHAARSSYAGWSGLSSRLGW